MKRITAFLLASIAAIALCGCCVTHDMARATCTSPRTCTKCGHTEGEPLGHHWSEPDGGISRICLRCGEVTDLGTDSGPELPTADPGM